MRVGIDTTPLYNTGAGIARYTEDLLSGLKDFSPAGFEFVAFASGVSNLDYKQPRRLLKTAYQELIWGPLMAPIQLAQLHVDLFHYTAGLKIAVPIGTPCVMTLHDLAILRDPMRFRRWHRWSSRLLMTRIQRMRKIICVSKFTADEAMRLLGIGSGRIEVVYNGCRFLNGDAAEEESPSSFSEERFLLFVGTLEPGKNLNLIHSVYELADETGIELPPIAIVGVRREGVEEERRASRLWHYLGRVSDGELVYLYRRAAALLFPSRYEGFGSADSGGNGLWLPCNLFSSICHSRSGR